MQITVDLGPRSYPIVLQSNSLDSFPGKLRKLFPESKIALVTNTTLARLYGPIILSWKKELQFNFLPIPDGEKHKTVDTWNLVIDFLLKNGLDRKSVVVALGGGVVGDIVGFAASAFLRGIACVQIPTTLLAMVDSSVGGKTGVNHPLGKNLIGAFHQPSLVWMDTAFLKTLPRREFVAGYAELFKYAFIGGRSMFDFVNTHHDRMMAGDHTALLEGIRRSVAIKAAVVASDEEEVNGKRALLNFGHTFAHAIERALGFKRMLHGEAVLFGMRCACDLGMRAGTVPNASRKVYAALLEKVPQAPIGALPDAHVLYGAMFTDKKISGGKLHFVLPAKPGESVMVNDVAEKQVLETLRAAMKLK
jgi:3-dehydroquinate synthase